MSATLVRERVPAHVPPELVSDLDIDRFVRELDDPYVAAARLHDGPEILWLTEAYRGHSAWFLTRYADIEQVYLDAERFSAREVTDFAQLTGLGWRLNPQEIDQPEHLGFRQVLQPFFQPSVIRRLDDTIRGVCRELIADLGTRRSFDFIGDFARFLPSRVFLGLMDLPQDRLDQFLAWEAQLIRGATAEERIGGVKSIVAYLDHCVDERRRRPGDDLISRILAAEVFGRPLTHDEVMGMCSVLYTAGLDTVLGSLGWHMSRITAEPALRDRLLDQPALIPDAVDELCRAYGVVHNRRTVIADCAFNGISMKAGDWIVLPTYLASRDARQFPDPHAIDLTRKTRGMTFGGGIHYCLGIYLARREMQIVLEEFLPGFPNLRPARDGGFQFHTAGVWGVDALPLEWG